MSEAAIPLADPEDWDGFYQIVTRKPCPECTTALGVMFGTQPPLSEVVIEMNKEYPVSVPIDWTDGYDHPVYVYCDNPVCSWHGVQEWARMRPVLSQWIEGGAPMWEERMGVIPYDPS